jgi:Na+(H+)/acetate symporter ActP
MLTIRAMSDGKGYSSRHLERNDYYSEGERVAGAWNGELSAGVRKSEAVALCHPIMPVGDGFGGRVVRINSRQL